MKQLYIYESMYFIFCTRFPEISSRFRVRGCGRCFAGASIFVLFYGMEAGMDNVNLLFKLLAYERKIKLCQNRIGDIQ